MISRLIEWSVSNRGLVVVVTLLLLVAGSVYVRTMPVDAIPDLSDVQVIVYTDIPKGYTEDQANKHRQAFAGIDMAFRTARKIGYENIAFGSDIITDPAMIARINDEFTFRTEWFSNAEVLRQATSKSGQLVGLSNRYNPGKIGVIEEGALADILLVSGDPLDDISVLTKPDVNLTLIMKDGKIYKNTVK